MNSKDLASKMLRALAGLVDKMNDQEFEELLAGQTTPSFLSRFKRKQITLGLKPNLADLARRLEGCATREEAHQLLSELPNRTVLDHLARSLKIHTVKSD